MKAYKQGYREYTWTVFKSGGSKALRINKDVDLQEGDKVQVKVFDGGEIVIKPKPKKSPLREFYEEFKDYPVDPDFMKDVEPVYLSEREERELF